MVLTLPPFHPLHRKRPFHEFMPLWKEHAASPRESRLASFNFHRKEEEEGVANFTINLDVAFAPFVVSIPPMCQPTGIFSSPEPLHA